VRPAFRLAVFGLKRSWMACIVGIPARQGMHQVRPEIDDDGGRGEF